MAISMAICELDSDASLCKVEKETIVMVRVDSVEGLEDHAEYTEFIAADDIAAVMGDGLDAFYKRNRIRKRVDPLPMEKVKDDGDRGSLSPKAVREYSGWIVLEGMDDDAADGLVASADEDDTMTAWDMRSFDEMNEACAACPMSWDKGRGCIGNFGPSKSLLPEIAERASCPIVASVFDAAEEDRILSVDDAKALLAEVEVLRERLPEEGKMMVHRYSGVVDRLEAMARVCVEHGTRFFFM